MKSIRTGEIEQGYFFSYLLTIVKEEGGGEVVSSICIIEHLSGGIKIDWFWKE